MPKKGHSGGLLKLLPFTIALCLIVGAIGGFFTAESVKTWYPTLIKPSFNPPNWLFGPVWTVLYIMMGISLYLVLNITKDIKPKIVFGTQLLLNLLWSILFFGLKNPLIAFIDIVLLWLSIIYTIYLFNKISKPSAYLLIPYLLWVTFASVLNISIVLLN